LKVILHNVSNNDFDVERGDRIAQLVFAPVLRAKFVTVESLSNTTRGEGGFGSTGTGSEQSKVLFKTTAKELENLKVIVPKILKELQANDGLMKLIETAASIAETDEGLYDLLNMLHEDQAEFDNIIEDLRELCALYGR
jgi:hypothetical protein